MNLAQMETALRNADAAGDVEAATQLARAIKQARVSEPAQDTRPPLQRFLNDLGTGVVRGAGSIGATLMAPQDMLQDFIRRKLGGPDQNSNQQRRQDMTDALQGLGANPDSLAFQGGKLGGEIAGTLGVGGVLANTLGRAAPSLAPAIETAGFTLGRPAATTLAGRVGDLGTRAAGGAITGFTAAGLVEPDQALKGAAVSAVLPGVVRGAAASGRAIGNSARSNISPEVAELARKANAMGIDVPIDRLYQSKPLDAIASGLNYLPFSGRAAVEAKMGEQLNQAASRTFGQNSSNVTQALRKADNALGGQFDSFLKSNKVMVDQQFLADIADSANKASKELGSDGAAIIGKQVDDIISKAATGEIDGQAAYNIKKTLDRIGNRNSPEAWYALDLKKKLMDALNRSVGPEQAQGFAQLRQQYGNMIELQKMAKNGVDGEISVARLANMKNINNQPLQDIADIAAQFVKPREGQHGAMQRALVGVGAGSMGGIPGLVGTATAGRLTNSLLNSRAIKGGLLDLPTSNAALPWEQLGLLGYRSAPLIVTDQ